MFTFMKNIVVGLFLFSVIVFFKNFKELTTGVENVSELNVALKRILKGFA